MKVQNWIFFIAVLALFSCKPEMDEVTTSAGTADFSRYVALGNSLTAGFTDNDLFLSGQLNSYPAILADQMKAAGGGEFKQPLMVDETGFGRRLVLHAGLRRPVPAGIAANPANFASIAHLGPFNNLGVPGAKSFHLLPGAEAFSLQNPYYRRFAANPGTSTILAEALAQNPTFFTLWIGNNDVLGYAASGGASDSITNPQLFAGVMNTLIQQLTSKGAKGAIANIPDISTIPFFTFMNTQIPFNGLVLNQPQQVAALNSGYAQLNALIKALGSTDTLAFALGPNPFVIADKELPWGIRQMKQGELFLLTLPADSLLNHGYGSIIPIPDRYVLTIAEINRIKNAIEAYNNTILSLANQYNLAHVDIHKLLKDVSTTGIERDGIKFTNEYVIGNTFSVDGVHITGRAAAIVANEFIRSINSKYNATLKEVSPVYYSGLYYY